MKEVFSIEDLPDLPGAYVLLIRLEQEQSFLIKTLGEMSFPAGSYVYCGSAKGPGGIRARVKRHLKREKKPHWHVDRLTIENGVESLSVFTDQTECDLIAKCRNMPGTAVLYSGFGSSDCRVCESHLLKLPDDITLETLGLSQPVFHPGPDPLS